MTGARVVWFHRCRATLWALAYPATVALGVADSVALVWFASCYANVVSDLGAAEAADDRAVLARLDRIESKLDELLRGEADRASARAAG